MMATTPPTITMSFTGWGSTVVRLGSDHAIAAAPIASAAPASRAGRRAGRGAGGRADRAAMTGMRAVARAGHHDAPVAVSIASTMPVTTTHHGTSKRSMRCPAAGSTTGARASQVSSPAPVPITAAAAPTAAPLASITSRTCLSVAPVAASSPIWRCRRCAITTNPAPATRATSSRTTVATRYTATAAVPRPVDVRSST